MIDKKDIRIKNVLGEYEASDEQLRICDFIAHGIGNGSVESRAGSGKSKTIELSVHFVPEGKKVLILSYNKHIAENLSNRFNTLTNKKIDVLTYHSLGLKILSLKYGNLKLDNNKYRNYIHENLVYLNSDFELFNSCEKARYIKNIESLFDYTRYNLMQSVKEIKKVALKYGITLFSNECDAVRKILKWGSENIKTIDYTDMIWLPYELGITGGIRLFEYDYIFVDEAQDSSPAQQNLINICTKRNTRLIIFGDSYQCINAWCGSDEDAFATFSKKPNMSHFKLNVSYRCGKKIAELARNYVNDFSTPNNAYNGEVNHNVSLDKIKEGDMVLCRLTSPLVKLYMQLLTQNKPVHINGIELGNDLINHLKLYETNNLNDTLYLLKKNLIDIWERNAEMYQTSLNNVVNESDVMIAYDEILTFNTLTDGLKTKDELLNRINQLFINNDKNVNMNDNSYIHLSTVHRAKGLESDNVFILCPSLMPNKMAQKDWEIRAETNILYVAITRAKKQLNFISEKEFPPEKSYSGNNELYNEFMKIKQEINC